MESESDLSDFLPEHADVPLVNTDSCSNAPPSTNNVSDSDSVSDFEERLHVAFSLAFGNLAPSAEADIDSKLGSSESDSDTDLPELTDYSQSSDSEGGEMRTRRKKKKAKKKKAPKNKAASKPPPKINAAVSVPKRHIN